MLIGAAFHGSLSPSSANGLFRNKRAEQFWPVTLQDLAERFSWPKVKPFFSSRSSSCPDMVPGAAGRVGGGRRLTSNDRTTEPTSPGVPASPLHALWENECPYCFRKLLHISVTCTERILTDTRKYHVFVLLWQEIGTDMDYKQRFSVIGFCMGYV